MRFATIGSNFIVDRFMEAAVQCEGFQLQVVYSRNAEQAEANRMKWGAQTACTSLDALANDPAVDAVYIASPNSVHYAQCERLLRAGKHVLCEKPIVPDEASFETLLHTAQQHGALLLEAMRPAFLPAVDMIRSLLPALGTLRFAAFTYCQYSSRYDRFLAGVDENAFNPTLCNGALMDIGVYCVHWLLLLFGLPAKVLSQAQFIDNAIDIAGTAICVYPEMQAHLRYAKVYESRCPCVLEGEKGSLLIEPFPIARQATLWPRNGSASVVSLQTPELDITCEIKAFMRLSTRPADALPYQQLSRQALRVMDCIRGETGIDFTRRSHSL